MNGLEKRFPVYAGVLKLYPASYRQRYAQEMLQTTADMLDATPTRFGRLAVWLRIIADLPVNIGRQQLIHAGGAMTTTMPTYVKRSGLTAGLLLVPFFAALIANGLDKVLFHRELSGSWLWRAPFIGLWVVWLPTLALLLAGASYLLFVCTRPAEGQHSWMRRALDVLDVWPLLLTGVVALGILLLLQFHDSAQCWWQSPGHLVSHLHQAWQCSTTNQAPVLMIMRRSLTGQ